MAHQQQGEAHENDYPHGRGYGHDYMRGGEVFDGYGYSLRDEYERPRGELMHEGEEGAPGEGSVTEIERFPQDERAGGWDVPEAFRQAEEDTREIES